MDNINSIDDMSDICRVCLEKSSKMYPLVGPILNTDVEIATMINYCTSVQITQDEDLPKGVCIPCFRTIRIAYNFISEFREINEKLLELKEELKIKQEVERQQDSSVVILDQEEQIPSEDYKYELEQIVEREENEEEEEDEDEKKEEIIIKYISDSFNNTDEKIIESNDTRLKQKIELEPQAGKHIRYRPLRKKAILKTFMCPICAKTFMKFESGFLTHLYSHKGVRIKCNKCMLEVEFEIDEFIHHYKKTHLYQCHICLRSFTKKSSQYYHMKIHTENKVYGCSFENCKKAFVTPWSLRKHLNTHSKLVKYICSKCGKKFNTYDTFRYHQKTHDGNRSHLCTECGRAFLQAVHLKYHMWKHTGIKQFHCDKCDKSYTSVTQLKKHLRKYCGVEKSDTVRT